MRRSRLTRSKFSEERRSPVIICKASLVANGDAAGVPEVESGLEQPFSRRLCLRMTYESKLQSAGTRTWFRE